MLARCILRPTLALGLATALIGTAIPDAAAGPADRAAPVGEGTPSGEGGAAKVSPPVEPGADEVSPSEGPGGDSEDPDAADEVSPSGEVPPVAVPTPGADPGAGAPVDVPLSEDAPPRDADEFGDDADADPWPEDDEFGDDVDQDPLPADDFGDDADAGVQPPDADYDPSRDSPQAIRARHWIRAGIVTLSAGGALLVGAVLMGASDPCNLAIGNSCQVDARNRASLVMGLPAALLIAGGTTALVIGTRRRRALAVDLQAGRGRLGVGLRGRF